MNNAGSGVHGNLEKCPVEDVDFMFSVHARSVFIITKRAMPHLKKTKGKIMALNQFCYYVLLYLLLHLILPYRRRYWSLRVPCAKGQGGLVENASS